MAAETYEEKRVRHWLHQARAAEGMAQAYAAKAEA